MTRIAGSNNVFVISGNQNLFFDASLFNNPILQVANPPPYVASTLQPLKSGYYVVGIGCQEIINDGSITYQSDAYPCPYDPQYRDYNLNF